MENHGNDVGNILKQKYTVEVRKDYTTDGDDIFFAQYLELEGCFGQGLNPEEAVRDLEEATSELLSDSSNDLILFVKQSPPKTSSDSFNFRFPLNIDNSKKVQHVYAEP